MDNTKQQQQSIIVGKGGASGKGWSELKDIECNRRYQYILNERKLSEGLPRQPTQYDEAYQCGSFLHAARAKWFELDQKISKEVLDECYAAGRDDCEIQGYPCSELSALEYQLMFVNYANYWSIRPKPKPYAVEYYLEHDFARKCSDINDDYKRSTRLDDVCMYPDVGQYCIGEFKTTYNLSGALKYYTQFNPQILLQQLLYKKAAPNGRPEIYGTMVDIWDKIKLKGTRHFIPLDERLLVHFENWLINILDIRNTLTHPMNKGTRNFMVCNTFNDAFNSQCKFKERCKNDED